MVKLQEGVKMEGGVIEVDEASFRRGTNSEAADAPSSSDNHPAFCMKHEWCIYIGWARRGSQKIIIDTFLRFS